MAIYHDKMRYIDFNINNSHCIHCYIADRAYASIITEVMTNGQNETGGVLLGYIINRAWYIVESVDPGIDTVNHAAFFRWDGDYVNHQAQRLSKIYKNPITILGFWHRHPGSMDYFSGQDESTIKSNLRELRAGLLSMLVNIDPKLRMTFYYCYDNEIMKIKYDMGNKYFPSELLQYADSAELSRRAAEKGTPMQIHYEQVIDLNAIAARSKPSQAQSKPAERREESFSSTARIPADTEIVRLQKSDNTRQPEISKDVIRQIAEVVLGIEGDTKEQITAVAQEMKGLKSEVSSLVDGVNDLLVSVVKAASKMEAAKESMSEPHDDKMFADNDNSAIEGDAVEITVQDTNNNVDVPDNADTDTDNGGGTND